MSSIYLALVHSPVLNKKGELVTTSVTNLDIHDIARSCRTFGIAQYFIVTPLLAQHQILKNLLGHWETDRANVYNPDRKDALGLITVVNQVDEAIDWVEKREKVAPLVVVTGASFNHPTGSAKDLKDKLKFDKTPAIVLFGTGWGLPASLTERAHYLLDSIKGYSEDGYNHLSVRSAVAIYLDRLRRDL